MSFIQSKESRGFSAGFFLADDHCLRETMTIAANHAQAVTLADGSKIVPAGAVIPANGSTAKGILYQDVEVTKGDMPGSVVTEGTIYEDRLPASLDSDAASALTGITVISAAPAVTRPDFGPGALKKITVESAAGTNVGDTALTLTGYTPGSGESYVYKVDTDAPVIAYNAKPDYTWTPWDGSSDITATSGKKITVASVGANGRVLAAGSATVTAKANG